MLKKRITYTNFADEQVTEDFYFHLTQTELTRLEVDTPGGLSETFRKILGGGDRPDGKLVMDTFENFIKRSYGKKSEDGRRHLKNAEILDDFISCGAYDALFRSIVTDAESAAAFVKAIMPAALLEEAEKMARQEQLDIKTPDLPAITPQIISSAALKEMELDQFQEMTQKIATGEVVVEG